MTGRLLFGAVSGGRNKQQPSKHQGTISWSSRKETGCEYEVLFFYDAWFAQDVKSMGRMFTYTKSHLR